MAELKFDTKEFEARMKLLEQKVVQYKYKTVMEVALELLRLSQFEVPHDTGLLQNSGHTERKDDGVLVGYNKVYAHRLHEHPEYKFQKGRKGKYLEDPMKNNLHVFERYFREGLEEILQ